MKIDPHTRSLCKNIETPFLLFDLDIVRENFISIKKRFPKSHIFYAVKANSHPRVLTLLDSMGSCFDIASKGELEKLISLGVSTSKISFGNTIKKNKDIQFAYKQGVKLFVADSSMEVSKIAEHAPGTKIFIRIEMDAGDSDWPLSHKFGTSKEIAVKLLIQAKKLGLIPYGVSFHVGSQCYNPKRWPVALEKCLYVFDKLKNENINLKMINLGGGFPIQHTKPIPTLDEITAEINQYLRNFDPVPQIFFEPGRSMVGNAGVMVSTIITERKYGRENWLFVDAGVFHGLMETIQDFRYELKTDRKSAHPVEYHLAGPSCDSLDIIYDNVILPKTLTQNDRLYFLNTGAYTIEYSSNFNGFEIPKIYFKDELTNKKKKKKK